MAQHMPQHQAAPRPQRLSWLLLLLGIGLLLPQLLLSATTPTSGAENSWRSSARALLNLGDASPMLFDLQAPGCRLHHICDGRAL